MARCEHGLNEMKTTLAHRVEDATGWEDLSCWPCAEGWAIRMQEKKCALWFVVALWAACCFHDNI